jgi:hypothetical protein
MISVMHAASLLHLPINSITVSRTRKMLREVCNIPSDAIAFVDGCRVSDTHVLRSGDSIEFLREWGVKGLGRLLDRSQLCLELGLSEKDYDHLVTLGLPVLELGDRQLHSEIAVDHFFQRLATSESKPDVVDSTYVAARLHCTTTWIADQARNREIPQSCIVVGTGHGKPWKFHRLLIDKWISQR